MFIQEQITQLITHHHSSHTTRIKSLLSLPVTLRGDLGEIAHFIMNQALRCAGNNHMIIPSC